MGFAKEARAYMLVMSVESVVGQCVVSHGVVTCRCRHSSLGMKAQWHVRCMGYEQQHFAGKEACGGEKVNLKTKALKHLLHAPVGDRAWGYTQHGSSYVLP